MIHSQATLSLHDYFIKAELGERTFLYIILFPLRAKKLTILVKQNIYKVKKNISVCSLFICKLTVAYHEIYN